MPSKIIKRGILRFRGNVVVQGVTLQKLFPDDSRKSMKLAIAWEEETRKRLAKELSKTATGSLTFEKWVNGYLDFAKDEFVHKTYDEKRSVFRRLRAEENLEPTFPVMGFSKSMCDKYLGIQKKTRSGHAANKDRKNLGAAWEWGKEKMEGWPEGENPFMAVKKSSEVPSPRYVPPEVDFWEVLKVAEGQDKVMLMAFLHLAARRGEIFRSKWSDVDFNRNRVRLWTRKRKGGQLEMDLIPMTSELRKALLEWKEVRKTHQFEDKEHVFVSLDEKPVSVDYLGKAFKVRQKVMHRLCKKANVKTFGFHAIRHLTASILYRKGSKPSLIQTLLRHKSSQTTARYLHNHGLEDEMGCHLENGLRESWQAVAINEKAPGRANSEGGVVSGCCVQTNSETANNL